MSDLAATNCGGCGCERSGGSNCIFLLLILFCCGGFGSSREGCGDGCGNNSCCDLLIWILLLSCFCGGNGFGSFGSFSNGCGCGC